MKRISTLAFMAFFFCLGSMAQVVLGDINFSLKEGMKINPATGKITVTFPNVTGVADPTTTSFVMAGAFNDIDFDGVEGTFANGVTLDLAEFELQPATDYALKITSVKVDGAELAPAEGYTLNFKTRGAERKMSWSFTIDEASAAQIVAEGTGNTDDVTKYIEVGKNRWFVPARNYQEIFLPDGTVLPMTEDLQFKFGNKAFYVGDPAGSYKDRICFNGNNQYMTIPDCKVGDVIAFTAIHASKNDPKKKFASIMSQYGNAVALDGFVSEQVTNPDGVADSITLNGTKTAYKFEVQVEGDITFKFGNCHLYSIEISEAQEKLPRNYNIVAAYVGEDNTTVLKELVAKTEGITGSTVKVNYPYWLVDENGVAYTHGTKGSEFVEAFDLKNGEGDTTFVVSYKKTAYEGVVFLSEGEDLTGAVECTSGNAAVRSSMAKAGYVTEDLKLLTLQPGTYKIRAVLFDANKEPSYICTLTKGEGEENEIYLSATATNFDERESDLLTLTEATDITLKAGGGDNQGIDVIVIYAATEEPDGIVKVNADAQKAVRKVAKNGQILIETEAGIFNALGVQMK